jgi:hypothetical protein
MNDATQPNSYKNAIRFERARITAGLENLRDLDQSFSGLHADVLAEGFHAGISAALKIVNPDK